MVLKIEGVVLEEQRVWSQQITGHNPGRGVGVVLMGASVLGFVLSRYRTEGQVLVEQRVWSW